MNALIPELKARGVEAIVVLIHEGGLPTGDYNECPGISGPIVDIVKKFDKAVDIVVSGHTHRAYVCEIDGRLVTCADKYGTLVTAIDVKLDPATRDIVSAKADNTIVRIATLSPRTRTDRADRSLRQGRSSHRQPPGGIGHGNAVARAQHGRREPARRHHRGRATRRDQRDDERRRGDRLHQSRRRPHRHHAQGRRRGDLCRPVRQPAVPQPAGDDDADRKADQGHAWNSNGSIRSGRGSCRSRRASATPGTTASRTASASSPRGCR